MKSSIWFLMALLMFDVGTPSCVQAHDAAPASARSATVKRAGVNTVAPDIKASALWDGRDLLDFHAIDNPPMVSAKDADFLEDEEYVLGISVNGEHRAYPTRFAAFHHVINDKFGSKEDGTEAFVTVTY